MAPIRIRMAHEDEDGHATRPYLSYRAGAEVLQVKFQVAHGSGVRYVKGFIAAERLELLIGVLGHFPRREWPHAFWHIENPERPIPCSTCVLKEAA